MTLDLIPYGDEKAKKTLKVIEIANTMTHEDPWKFGNYKCRFKNALHYEVPWKFKYIMNFPRSQYDAMYLLYLILRKYVHEHYNPIDARAEGDKDASGGSGHNLLPGVRRSVGQFGKRDHTQSGSTKLIKGRIRRLKAEAVSIWEQELQKNDLSGVQGESEEVREATLS